MFHFHRNKWQTTVLQYLGYQMFSPLQTNYLPKVMKCRWCSLTTKHTGMRTDKAIKIPSDHMLKISLVFTFVDMPRWYRSICLISLSMVLKPVWCLLSEAKEVQIQTGEKPVEKVPLECDKLWCSIFLFRQSLKFQSQHKSCSLM